MPSSISDSDPSRGCFRPDRFTIVLLGTAFLALALLEGVSRGWFANGSKTQRREGTERRELLAIRDNGTGKDTHIALLGNSLMLEGLYVPLFEANLNSRYIPVPYFVLGTNYYDWYFGLKRLFAEGTRPRYVVLGLSPNQLASPDIRGDISAHDLFEQSDLLDIVRLTHMDATRASEFLLAHYSEYYSTRDITRGYVMSRVLPGVGEMFHNQAVSYRDPAIDELELKPLAASRLADLDRLCRANGAQFLLVVPPTYQKGAATILSAGRTLGVTVLVPVDENEFDYSDYQEDGIHMNQKGAEVFTARLAHSLNIVLQK